MKKLIKELEDLNLDAMQALARLNGIVVICAECPELLTAEELQEAIDMDIKEPICNDCYQDFFSDAFNEEHNRHGA